MGRSSQRFCRLSADLERRRDYPDMPLDAVGPCDLLCPGLSLSRGGAGLVPFANGRRRRGTFLGGWRELGLCQLRRFFGCHEDIALGDTPKKLLGGTKRLGPGLFFGLTGASRIKALLKQEGIWHFGVRHIAFERDRGLNVLVRRTRIDAHLRVGTERLAEFGQLLRLGAMGGHAQRKETAVAAAHAKRLRAAPWREVLAGPG